MPESLTKRSACPRLVLPAALFTLALLLSVLPCASRQARATVYEITYTFEHIMDPTVPSADTYLVRAGSTLYISNDVYNQGTIVIDPGAQMSIDSPLWLTNAGSVTIGGSLLVDLNTVLDNLATFSAQAGSTVTVMSGEFRNTSVSPCILAGTFTTNGNTSKITNDSGGSLVNSGTLTNQGTLSNIGASTLTNSGTLRDSYRITNELGSTLVNETGGLLKEQNHGEMENSGALVNRGTIVVESGGSFATYGGGSLTSSGTVTIDSGGAMGSSGTFTSTGSIANSGSLGLDAASTNAGTLTNNAGGTLTVSGTLTNSGTLSNAGTVSGAGAVVNSGILSSTGDISLGSLSVLSGSSLRLGNGVTVTLGSADLSPTARYQATAAGAGTATLTSTAAFAQGFTASDSTAYPLYRTVFTVPAGGHSATLSTTERTMGEALGGNGAALDQARAGAGANLGSLFTTLYGGTDAGAVRDGARALSGEGVHDSGAAILAQAGAFRNAVGQRQSGSAGGGSSLALAADNGLWTAAGLEGPQNGPASLAEGLYATLDQALALDRGQRPGDAFASVKGQAQWTHQGARGGLSGYDAEMGLAALGYDAPVSGNVRLGLAAGYSGGQSRGAGSTVDLRSWLVGLYGSLDLGGFLLDGDLSYARTAGRLHGRYTFPVADSTSGRFDADSLSAGLKLSHVFTAWDGLRLTPSIGLEAGTSIRGAFTESGGTIVKHYGESTMNSLNLPAGLALGRDFAWEYAPGAQATLSPEISAYYVRQMADTQPQGRVTLLDASAPVLTRGADPGRNLARANLGLRAACGDLRFSLFYNGEYGDGYVGNGLTLEVKLAF